MDESLILSCQGPHLSSLLYHGKSPVSRCGAQLDIVRDSSQLETISQSSVNINVVFLYYGGPSSTAAEGSELRENNCK